MEEQPREGAYVLPDGGDRDRKPPGDQSTLELMRSIASDTGTLVRKEVELAKQEITEAVTARIKAVAATAAVGVLALFMLAFLASALAEALDGPLTDWAARLIVAGIFLVLAGIAFIFGRVRFKKPPLAPEETKRTVKEDVEWAKAQLKR